VAETARRSDDGWSRNLDALGALLRRSGREDLLTRCLEPMRRCLDANPHPDESLKRLLREAVQELKSCITEPDRDPRIDIFEAIDAHATAPEDLLGLFAHAPDDELEGVLAAIDWEADAAHATVKDELGTLREPLLGAGAADGDQARVLMKGELQPGLLSDLIQLFAQNQETGRLLIEDKRSRRSGSLYFLDGHLANAICDGAEAERGFYNVMKIGRGRFYYQRGVKVAEVKIEQATQHLILDTLRLIDEAS